MPCRRELTTSVRPGGCAPPRSICASSAGGSSPITSSPTFPIRRRAAVAAGVRSLSLGRRRRTRCAPGSGAGRAIPLVDAGMRELWTTGWMHNRVRMLVGVVPGEGSAAAVASGARAGSGTRWSTPTWRTIPSAGNGRPAVAPTRRRTSASSTRSARGRSSIRMGTTCGAGCRSWPACRPGGFISRGWRRHRFSPRPGSRSGARTRRRSSITAPPAAARWRRWPASRKARISPDERKRLPRISPITRILEADRGTRYSYSHLIIVNEVVKR